MSQNTRTGFSQSVCELATMSPFGTKREFSPERLKGRKPPHCRRSGLNVGSSLVMS